MSTPMEPEKQWPMWTVASLLLAATLIVLAMLMCNGCSLTTIKDDLAGPSATTTTTAPDGTITTEKHTAASGTRKSSSWGVWHQPPAPKHGAMTSDLQSASWGEAGGDWMWQGGGAYSPFFWAGIIIVLIGLGVVFLAKQASGWWIVIIGGAFITAGFLMEEFPLIFLFIIIAMLGLCVLYLWKSGTLAKWQKALTQTVAAVEAVKVNKPVEEKKAINDALKGEQDKDVRDLVDALGATRA